MSDALDLADFLKSWPYDPDNEARVVSGRGGRQILQVRTPMGVEQYELDGRPDGVRPHGRESALEFQLQRLEQACTAGREKSFQLSPSDCTELFNEGTLFYFRYVRLFQLKDWPRTVRDTARNLKCFDLVRRYAQREEDQQYLEKWRPYLIRVNAAAAALLAADQEDFAKATEVTRKAIEQIDGLEDIEDETFSFEKERSLGALKDLAEQIQKNRPVSRLEQLEKQMRQAIERQEFERAAVLRDKIRSLKNPK